MDTTYKPDPKDWPSHPEREINKLLLDAIRHGLKNKPGSYLKDVQEHCAPLCSDHERLDLHLCHLIDKGEVRMREDDFEHDWQYLIVQGPEG